MLLEPLWILGDARTFVFNGTATDYISINGVSIAWTAIEVRWMLGDFVEVVLRR